VFSSPFCGLRQYETACPNGKEAMHQKAGAVRCDIHHLYDVTVANVDDTLPRGEYT